MDLWMEEIPDPALTYFKPNPKPAVKLYPPCPPFQSDTSCVGQDQYMFPLASPQLLPSQGFCNPSNGFGYSRLQQQSLSYEGERRRVFHTSSWPQVNAESLITALSNTPSPQQKSSNQVTADCLIHDEVTRAAKTLFSKRNRTLLHWLNPDVSKNQLKIDVNAAWDSLPAVEKVFYISQVLGKFAPHTTSLMVNPQLEPSKKDNVHITIKTENGEDKVNTGLDSDCLTDIQNTKQTTFIQSYKKFRARTVKREKKQQKRKNEYISSDETSYDSGLVVDLDANQTQSESKTTVKRKYTKRKTKKIVKEENKATKIESSGNSCSVPMPIAINDIKVEPKAEEAPTLPKAKRKYVKRKLTRKKYTKREHKNRITEVSQPQEDPFKGTENNCKSVKQMELPSADNSEDMELWIDLNDEINFSKEADCFKLLSEEVDSFWDTIGDPSNLFMELELDDVIVGN